MPLKRKSRKYMIILNRIMAPLKLLRNYVNLAKPSETISQRTVGKYMREMGIRAQWTKPWTTTTKDSDFSKELHNILNEQFNPERPNAVWCTDITYIWTQDGFVYYGFVCQKNHCLDSCRHYGSINSYRNNQQDKSLS